MALSTCMTDVDVDQIIKAADGAVADVAASVDQAEIA